MFDTQRFNDLRGIFLDKFKSIFFKVFLYISFIPYIVLLLIAIYHAVFGHDVYTLILPQYVKTIYGMEAFCEVLFLNTLILCYYPVLPICFLYQIIYGICCVVRKYFKK